MSALMKALNFLDLFKNSSSARLTGEILANVGQVYFDLLQDFESAKDNFQKAKNLGDRLSPTPTWLPHVIAGLRKIVELEVRAKPSDESLGDISAKMKLKLDHSQEAFIKFILKTHPPRHSSAFRPEDWKDPVVEVDKKLLVSMLVTSFVPTVGPNKLECMSLSSVFFRTILIFAFEARSLPI